MRAYIFNKVPEYLNGLKKTTAAKVKNPNAGNRAG